MSASRPAAHRPPSALLFWVPVALYAGLIWYLSSRAVDFPIDRFPLRDKGVHFLEYGFLALLTSFAIHRSRPEARFPLLGAVWITIGLGLVDELHQTYVPERSGDVLDLLADACGAVVFAALYMLLRRRGARRSLPTTPLEGPRERSVNPP